MKNIIHAVVLLTLIGAGTPAVAADSSSAYEGRRLYVSYCQLCHGTEGKGDGPLAKAMKISP
ncbi:MAG: cytochrome c, partial [Gammaproteobacteria bacterium]|nr:cytochrome c [Gammaproteobacteria bacterium]